jgi:dTDP-4-dehydrorhamnose reductase
MKRLVTGVKGQLGYDVVKELNKRNIECLGVDIDDFDITDDKAANAFIKNYNPDCVIHCSAYTAY